MKIRALPRRRPRRSRGQRGQVAVILAFLMIFLILMLGLVTDSVRLFILSTQAIRAAEAGALAGALYMPNYYNTLSPDGNDAVSRVCAAVQQNGITNCPASAGQDGAMPSTVAGNPYEVQVTVTLTANVFFLDFVLPNLSTSTVSRSSIAQYLPPIQLGSRSVYFGDEADGVQQFWARLNGPSALQENGDAYTPTWQEGPTDPIAYPDASSNIYPFVRFPLSLQTTNHQQWPAAIANPDQQPPGFTDADGTPGYAYEIVVPPGAGNVEVQIYNPVFDPTTGCCNGNGQDDLGPSACLDPNFGALGACTSTDKSKEYLQMHYALYSAPLPFERSKDTLVGSEFSPPSLDTIPADDTAHGCAGATPYWDPVNAYCPPNPGYVRSWYTLATITTPGTYRLMVAATGYHGEHEYAIKLTDPLGNPAPGGTRIWAWNNECVYFTAPNTDFIFDLGEIPAAYAGKTLNFSLFDPGDVSGTNDMRILDPSGNPIVFPSWLRTEPGSGGTELAASKNSDRIYNGLWLHIPITIPVTYNPAPGSDWWQIEYIATTKPNDTITISIGLSGSPVHLISEVL